MSWIGDPQCPPLCYRIEGPEELGLSRIACSIDNPMLSISLSVGYRQSFDAWILENDRNSQSLSLTFNSVILEKRWYHTISPGSTREVTASIKTHVVWRCIMHVQFNLWPRGQKKEKSKTIFLMKPVDWKEKSSSLRTRAQGWALSCSQTNRHCMSLQQSLTIFPSCKLDILHQQVSRFRSRWVEQYRWHGRWPGIKEEHWQWRGGIGRRGMTERPREMDRDEKRQNFEEKGRKDTTNHIPEFFTVYERGNYANHNPRGQWLDYRPPLTPSQRVTWGSASRSKPKWSSPKKKRKTHEQCMCV